MHFHDFLRFYFDDFLLFSVTFQDCIYFNDFSRFYSFSCFFFNGFIFSMNF